MKENQQQAFSMIDEGWAERHGLVVCMGFNGNTGSFKDHVVHEVESFRKSEPEALREIINDNRPTPTVPDAHQDRSEAFHSLTSVQHFHLCRDAL
jgi:hypothetical protein